MRRSQGVLVDPLDWPIDGTDELDLSYSLTIERVGDEPASLWVDVSLVGREWIAQVQQWAQPPSTVPVSRAVDRLVVKVPLSLPGPPSDLRFQAST